MLLWWGLLLFIAFLLFATIIFLILKFICPYVPSYKLDGKHVFITGGSKGIGFALAVEAVKNGASVSILARNGIELAIACSKLEKLANEQNIERGLSGNKVQQARFYECDLTHSYDEIVSVLTAAQRQLGAIDVLINNAGAIPAQGAIESISAPAFERSLRLNVVSAQWVTKSVVKEMKGRGEGRVVFVSSAAGQLGIWGYTAYSPAKFALIGLAQALQMELEPHNIRVTVVYPPNTDTEGFKEELKSMTPEIKAISEEAGLWQPEKVAKKAINDIVKGHFTSTFGVDGWMLGTLTAGFAPVTSTWTALQQICLMGLLRLVSLCYHKKFSTTIRNLQRTRAHSD